MHVVISFPLLHCLLIHYPSFAGTFLFYGFYWGDFFFICPPPFSFLFRPSLFSTIFHFIICFLNLPFCSVSFDKLFHNYLSLFLIHLHFSISDVTLIVPCTTSSPLTFFFFFFYYLSFLQHSHSFSC